MIVEHAFAVLGRGRCLLQFSRPAEATASLERARQIFAELRAAPALAETEALLDQATAVSA
jgi:flagellin-specific chaperone FliS